MSAQGSISKRVSIRTLIVIPTYNEIENLKSLVESIHSTTPEEVEVLVVDDASPDGTGQLADTMGEKYSRVHVMHREGKLGLGTAYRAGFKWGLTQGYGQFIEMDADFSHNPTYLPHMLENLKEADVVIGSRYVKGGGTVNWGLGRKLLSRFGSLYSRMILGVGLRDFTGGFNGWKRHVLEAIKLDTIRSDGYSFQIELKYRASQYGAKIVEFPIVFEDRKVGQSKMNKKIVIEALGKVWGFRFSPTSSEIGQVTKKVRRQER